MGIALSKMSKKGLVNFLQESNEELELAEEVSAQIDSYLDQLAESSRNVTKPEIYELAQTVKTQADELEPVESKLKKKKKSGDKDEKQEKVRAKLKKDLLKKSKKEDKETEEDKDKPEDKPDKKEKKKSKKKKKKLKAVKTKDREFNKEVIFPEELENELGEFELALDIETDEDLADAIENGEEFIATGYWSKKMLKMYNYDRNNINDDKIKEFPDDLDVLEPIQIIPGKVTYATSVYTDVCFYFTEESFEVVEGNCRYHDGLRWNIYRKK